MIYKRHLLKRLHILKMAHQDSTKSSLPETQEKDISCTRRVPIIEISKESADYTWSAAVEAIKGATYVALDLVS